MDNPLQFQEEIVIDCSDEGCDVVVSEGAVLSSNLLGRDDLPPHKSATQSLQRAYCIALYKRDLRIFTRKAGVGTLWIRS